MHGNPVHSTGVVGAGRGGACLKLGEDWTVLGVACRLRRSDRGVSIPGGEIQHHTHTLQHILRCSMTLENLAQVVCKSVVKAQCPQLCFVLSHAAGLPSERLMELAISAFQPASHSYHHFKNGSVILSQWCNDTVS